MTTYIGILETEAQAVDPTATARTFRPIEADSDTPFLFVDTASSRAGIANYTAKLAVPSVAIVGLGGTGAYLLDLIAKTPIAEIHLFDGDRFLQHNAFRAPGSTDLETLASQPNKAEHWASVYGRMRRGVVPHAYHLEPDRVAELDGMHTVFIAIDDGAAKRAIIDHLDTTDTLYIDVGMGLYHGESGLAGTLRVTASAPETRSVRGTIPMDAAHAADPYDTNIQVAELNALNAALAVLRWKKRLGFYANLDAADLTTFDIDGTHVINEAA